MILKQFSTLLRCKRGLISRNLHDLATIVKTHKEKALGKQIKVQGWIRDIRKLKHNIFVDLTDGSTSEHLQVVLKKCDDTEKISYGTSISAEGELRLAPNGKVELQASNISVIGKCDVTDGYPFYPKKSYPDEYIREYLHFRPRTRKFASLLRLRDIATSIIGEHLRNRGFISVHTPILTSNDCEGAGQLFTIKPDSEGICESMHKKDVAIENAYFNTKVHLTVSGQLQLEAVARALMKVFTFGPIFRAENSKSRLHLSEFYMLEAEMAFVRQLEEIANEIETLIKSVTRTLVEKGKKDMQVLEAPEPHWLNEKFGYVTYEQALNIIKEHGNGLTVPLEYGENLSKKHELFLVQHNRGIPLFVVNWPKILKSFYVKECGDSAKVEALDLLVPIVGELVGGSVREDDYEKLKLKLPSNPNLAWYLELRKFGNVPTGGFGMGFERYLQFVLGIANIKDTIPFPRWPHNCSL